MDDLLNMSILAAFNGKISKKTYIQVHEVWEVDELEVTECN